MRDTFTANVTDLADARAYLLRAVASASAAANRERTRLRAAGLAQSSPELSLVDDAIDAIHQAADRIGVTRAGYERAATILLMKIEHPTEA